MIAPFCLIIICFFCLSSWIPEWHLSPLSLEFHKKCLQMSSLQSELQDIYKALICGKRLPEGSIKESFIRNGLIHLMVVSGAHLLFLEKFWKKVNPPFFQTGGIIILLTLYTLTANLHPPVLRALFSFLLLKISSSYKLFWNSFLITHLSGILCLIYSPSWVFSPSLHLSWLASLSQNASPSRLKKSLLTYIIILPICNRWQFLHPFTVFINWIIAPFIGAVLFPLSLLTILFPPVHFITDKLWTGILKFLSLFQMFLPDFHLIKWSVPESGVWIYILLVFIVLQISSIYKKRIPASDSYKNHI